MKILQTNQKQHVHVEASSNEIANSTSQRQALNSLIEQAHTMKSATNGTTASITTAGYKAHEKLLKESQISQITLTKQSEVEPT